MFDVIEKIKETGTTDRRKGSGRPNSAVNAENLAMVEELILSQEEEPGTHFSQRKNCWGIERQPWLGKQSD